jgi:hypothetical protein
MTRREIWDLNPGGGNACTVKGASRCFRSGVDHEAIVTAGPVPPNVT